MWFLRDIGSGEKVSPDFSSQAKLARFMQILPQTLHKAIQEKRNIFKFRERNVRVVQEKILHWTLSKGTGPSETLIETFETVSDLAKWLKVTTQAVYAAINRGLKHQIKNKEGTVFWLRKFQETAKLEKEADEVSVSLPQENPPPVPPVPAPRTKKVPPVPAPRTKKVPPVPAPRTKKVPPVPPAPVPQNEIEEDEKAIAEIMKKVTLAKAEKEANTTRASVQREFAMLEMEKLDRQERHYTALRLKYYRWFLDDEVNREQEETTMVLYNEDTGEDVPVENYEDIANYFQSKEYVTFLSRENFNATLRQGKIKFRTLTKDYKLEYWDRLIFIRDPTYA